MQVLVDFAQPNVKKVPLIDLSEGLQTASIM